MFEKQELVMHGTAGVCRVDGTRTLDGEAGEYYVLTPVYLKDATFYTPVENNGKIKIRPVMCREEAEALVERMKSTEPFRFQSVNEQKQRCTEILKSGDSYELFRLAKTLYADRERRKRMGKKVSAMDMNATMLKKAELLLFGELATALGMEFDGVQGYLNEKLEILPA